MDYTPRIQGFQVRDVSWFYDPKKEDRIPLEFDIVKWYQHEPMQVTSMRTCKIETISESCFSVGFLIFEPGNGFRLQSVGLRWLEADVPSEVNSAILEFTDKAYNAVIKIKNDEMLGDDEINYALLPRLQRELSGST